MPNPRQNEKEAPDDMPEDPLCKKQRPMVKASKEAQCEAFSKDSRVIRVAQWTYCKVHKAIFKQERLYDLTSVFQQMARDINLLNSEIHEVQEVWTS